MIKDKKYYDEFENECLDVMIKQDIAYVKAKKWKKVYEKTKGKSGVINKLLNRLAKRQNRKYVDDGTKALTRQLDKSMEVIKELSEYLDKMEESGE